MNIPGLQNADEFERSLVITEDFVEDGPTPTPQARPAATSTANQPSVALEMESESATRQTSSGKKDDYKGKRLGQYRLIRVVGGGSMGVVFQAEDVNLKRMVALKVLRKRIVGVSEHERVDLFLREARAVASIDHPNIVNIHQIEDIDGWWYIAMEFIEGGALDDAVKHTGPMAIGRACMLLADAADGLIEAHEVGIVHRDVKPGNLMITRRGSCKVTDFGLVKIEEESDPFHEQKKFVGTPAYMPPEIARKTGAYPASDVYSLAATAYYLFSGKPLFSGKDWKDVLRHQVRTLPEDIRLRNPKVSAELATMLQACLAKDHYERPTMLDLGMAFRREAARSGMNMNSASGMHSAITQSAIMNSSTVGHSAIQSSILMEDVNTQIMPSDTLAQGKAKSDFWLYVVVALLLGVLLGAIPFVLALMGA